MYKIGDCVVCINNTYIKDKLEIGKVYTVVRLVEYFDEVVLKEVGNRSFKKSRFLPNKEFFKLLYGVDNEQRD